MELSKTQKIWLGIGTFAPLLFYVLYFITFFGFVVLMATTAARGEDPEMALGNLGAFFSTFGLAFLWLGLAGTISLATLIIYIIIAVKNPRFDSNDRLLWILLFIFAGFIGKVIYFFLYVVKSPSNASGTQGKLAHS